MKLSVCVTAYNHAPYIAQALDSVLMQETNFDYEILVGEDDSTDGTREIVKQYARAHSDRIRLFLNDRKNVIYINGRPTGRWNFMNNLRHAQGEYIALLDGDDYWTSRTKLKTQVDYLDANRDCALCAHRVKVETESSEPQQSFFPRLPSGAYGMGQFMRSGGSFMAAGSIMFRREHVARLPDWFSQVPFADSTIVFLCIQKGSVVLLDDAMGVWRVHRAGRWSGMPLAIQQAHLAQCMEFYRHEVNRKQKRRFSERIVTHYFRAAQLYEANGEAEHARSAMKAAIHACKSPRCFRKIKFRVALRLLYPGLILTYRFCKRIPSRIWGRLSINSYDS